MLAAHDELIAAAGDRLTVLHLGDPADVEAERLYLALAGSTTPRTVSRTGPRHIPLTGLVS